MQHAIERIKRPGGSQEALDGKKIFKLPESLTVQLITLPFLVCLVVCLFVCLFVCFVFAFALVGFLSCFFVLFVFVSVGIVTAYRTLYWSYLSEFTFEVHHRKDG